MFLVIVIVLVISNLLATFIVPRGVHSFWREMVHWLLWFGLILSGNTLKMNRDQLIPLCQSLSSGLRWEVRGIKNLIESHVLNFIFQFELNKRNDVFAYFNWKKNILIVGFCYNWIGANESTWSNCDWKYDFFRMFHGANKLIWSTSNDSEMGSPLPSLDSIRLLNSLVYKLEFTCEQLSFQIKSQLFKLSFLNIRTSNKAFRIPPLYWDHAIQCTWSMACGLMYRRLHDGHLHCVYYFAVRQRQTNQRNGRFHFDFHSKKWLEQDLPNRRWECHQRIDQHR